jgi:UDP-N-acetylmuramate: L-alanyl-gamma-D-glutamyl-meso-diaminopimelate ligase
MYIHILGICGTFMGGLAALAREAGHRVTGCDTGVYPPMSDQLRALGIELIEGYGADQIELAPDVFVVGNVVSRARLSNGNPRYPLMEAILDSGAPYTSGPQWLAENVLQGRHVLAVAGTHGKTTTTAMLAWILEGAGLQPGFLVGGVPLNFDVSARLGGGSRSGSDAETTLRYLRANGEKDAGDGRDGGDVGSAVGERAPRLHQQGPRDWLRQTAGAGLRDAALLSAVQACTAGLEPRQTAPSGGSAVREATSVGATFVIEADEYDTAFFDKRSKFVHYRPRTAILNNLEFDHADIFDDLAAIERQFHHLLRTVPPSGCVVWNAVEANLQHVLAQGCWSGQVLFGSSPLNKDGFTAAGEPHDFDVLKGGAVVGHVAWAIGGAHNQLNALAAIAAAEHVGVAPSDAAKALASFQNVKRRMELRGTIAFAGGDIAVYDDFAHHPTAIRTTVDGLRRQLDSAGKKSARILAIFEPRSNTMKLGSMTAQLPWSLEQADLAFCHAGGLTWDARAALTPMAARAQVSNSIDELMQQVLAAVKPGDQLLCMSNGGFGGVHARLLAALGERAGTATVDLA